MNIVAATSQIVRTTLPWPASSWQEDLRTAFRDVRKLLQDLELPPDLCGPSGRIAADFPLFVPRFFAGRMQKGNPRDPLLLQVLPAAEEALDQPGFSADPVSDASAAVSPGLLHKYPGRVLLVLTGACAVHCRYCFRRHFPYDETPRSPAEWEAALAAIARDASIHEVILSGGDPLMLVDATLAELAERIAAIPHVRRLRIHTRVPIMIPARVTDELLSWLRGTRLTPVVVVHVNHPRELGDGSHDPVPLALGRLVDAGVPVLNQAVLLAGVNDDLETLVKLCERLVDLRILPYYLHQLDRVSGAAHFEVSEARGMELVALLRERLPGYAVPRYVRETPSAASKLPIN